MTRQEAIHARLMLHKTYLATKEYLKVLYALSEVTEEHPRIRYNLDGNSCEYPDLDSLEQFTYNLRREIKRIGELLHG